MADNDLESDPVTAMIQAAVAERQRRSDEHAALRASDAYKASIRQIDRYIFDYGLGINMIEMMASRNPPFFEQLISLRIKPHFVQSMIAAAHMIKEGLHDPARREMRFLVEASVKALWLDQGSPPLRQDADVGEAVPPRNVAEKVTALDGLGRERFNEVVDSLRFGMLDETAGKQYRQAAKSLYGTLSTTTHVSSRNVQRDLANFERGKHFAFETIADINAIAGLLRQVLDVALASHFEAFDHGLVGDLFEPHFQPAWSYLKMPLVGAIDRHFDHKHERRVRRGEVG
ncbi:hypothetical protein [Chelativorans sp. J32]|uniref:hypothetical protein n=1 Tax=Chelativorans sp. J32 TaxID=935840 RepID=UPI000480307A|nr:hypothetical protein [Chelativorans sp. J32]